MNSLLKINAAVGLAIVLTIVLATGAAGQDQTVENRIREVEGEFKAAEDADWHLYAPKNFAEAVEKLGEARERFQRGGKIESITSALDEAQAKLQAAGGYTEIGAIVLTSAITARSDAITAGAPQFAPEEWERAKEVMYDAGRNVEKGKGNDARRDAKKAEDEFRAAELKAIRVDLLGGARTAESTAQAAGADKKAPQTFARAVKELEEAERTLEGDRYQRAQAIENARAATAGFRHATLIAGHVDRIGADRPGEYETTQLAYEDAITAAAGAINVSLDFTEGLTPARETLLGSVSSLKTDRDNLGHELTVATERIAVLEADLAKLEEKEQSVSAAMREERKRKDDLVALRQLFSVDEAVIVQEGGDLVCRVYGISFATGSTVIRPEAFQLLTKIQSALRIYPKAAVTVEGHTDAQGDSELNQRLSEERAEAVRSYIVANMPADAGRISSTGYGETVPLASNETAEGRAKNRRIDIRLSALYGDQ